MKNFLVVNKTYLVDVDVEVNLFRGVTYLLQEKKSTKRIDQVKAIFVLLSSSMRDYILAFGDLMSFSQRSGTSDCKIAVVIPSPR